MKSTRARLNSAGFSLIEGLVSISIFSIFSVFISQAFIVHLGTNTRSENSSLAIFAAQKVLDDLRQQDPATMPTTGTATQTVTIDGKPFSVVTAYCSPNTYCTSTNIKAIKITVNYRNKKFYEVDTVFSQLR